MFWLGTMKKSVGQGVSTLIQAPFCQKKLMSDSDNTVRSSELTVMRNALCQPLNRDLLNNTRTNN